MAKPIEGDSSLQRAEPLVGAILDAGEIQAGGHGSFIGAEGDRGVGSLDAVAGSEFVDDRIRLE